MTKAEAGRLGALKKSENIRMSYVINPKRCKYCNAVILWKDRHSKVFCNHSCAAKYNNAIRGEKSKKTCINCGSKCKNKFCCIKCRVESIQKDMVRKWKNKEISGLAGYSTANFIRKYLFQKYDGKCCKCGWNEVNPVSKKVPLQINHIDGNYKNCDESNLELICPNCHALTANFGSLNNGAGREKRRERYKEGKTY